MVDDVKIKLDGRLRRVSQLVTGLGVALLVVGLVWSLIHGGHTWSRDEILSLNRGRTTHQLLLFAIAVIVTVPSARVFAALVHYASVRRMADLLVAAIVLAELVVPLLVHG